MDYAWGTALLASAKELTNAGWDTPVTHQPSGQVTFFSDLDKAAQGNIIAALWHLCEQLKAVNESSFMGPITVFGFALEHKYGQRVRNDGIHQTLQCVEIENRKHSYHVCLHLNQERFSADGKTRLNSRFSHTINLQYVIDWSEDGEGKNTELLSTGFYRVQV